MYGLQKHVTFKDAESFEVKECTSSENDCQLWLNFEECFAFSKVVMGNETALDG